MGGGVARQVVRLLAGLDAQPPSPDPAGQAPQLASGWRADQTALPPLASESDPRRAPSVARATRNVTLRHAL